MKDVDRHTLIVKWARRILPLLAILIISSIFFFETEDALRDDTFVVTQELRDAATKQKVTNPQFSGLTRDGDVFTVIAKEALPDGPEPNSLDLIDPSINVETEKGVEINTVAQKGEINFENRRVSLQGGVELNSTNGFTAKTDQIFFDLDTGDIKSPGAIEASGSVGEIKAGSMQANQSLIGGTDAQENIIHFDGGVHVLYQPKGRYKE